MIESTPAKNSNGYILYLFGAILVATIGIRVYNYFWPQTSTIPMLPRSPDMIELVRFEDVASHTLESIALPEKMFGSEPYVIGIYPSKTKTWPAHSVAIVLTKDDARFAEIDILPGAKLEPFSEPYLVYPQDSVVIHGDQTGKMIRLRRGFDCTHPKPNTIPAMCLITNTLMFEQDGNLIQISSDGNHMTEGEMLEMARSMR